MLVIRYQRIGRKNQPSYRVIVTDKRRSAKGGRAVEILGTLNPSTKKRTINKERVLYWISKGAQPSATAHNLLISEKIIEGEKIPTHAKQKGEVAAPTTPVAVTVPVASVAPAAPVTPPPAAVEPTPAPEQKPQ